LTRTVVALAAALAFTPALFAFPKVAAPTPPVDLTGYATVERAVQAKTAPSGAGSGPAFLGVSVVADPKGRAVADEVAPRSPADKAGIKKGDVFTHVGGEPVRTPTAFREWVQAQEPGRPVAVKAERDGKPVEVTVTLEPVSRPRKLGGAYLGIELGERKEDEGVKIERVAPRSPADRAGIAAGDRLKKINGTELQGAGRLADTLSERRPGDELTLTVRHDGKDKDVKVTLRAEGLGFGPGGGGGPGGGMIGGRSTVDVTRTNVVRLAVIPIEFADTKHNSKITPAELEKQFFSTATYIGQNATGQPVAGSLNDYFREQSAGKFHIEGMAFDWVEVAKKRGDYIQGSGTSNKTAVLTDALDKLTAKAGADALDRLRWGHWTHAPKPADAVLFVYAGDRVPTNRGAVYYPHAGAVVYKGKRIPYLIGPEGGSRLAPVGTFVKELGQVLGLPDLAARTENVGSEGLGRWCAMSDPFTTNRPQHLSAWCKEKLGWLTPAVIDPTKPQKLVLAPVESSPKECVKVLVRPDGSEYFLLEVRARKGFDADLPGEGLLIWRVVNGRPILEESHGVEGPTGPTVHLGAVPYPSPANTSFTPDTIPSSRSPKGGGLPVHITDIRRLPDGRVCFRIGYEFD
jgi:M6 family metalloprotease-like protein